jgi:hypothetical protein
MCWHGFLKLKLGYYFGVILGLPVCSLIYRMGTRERSQVNVF